MSVGLQACIAVVVGTALGVTEEATFAAVTALAIVCLSLAIAWPRRVTLLVALTATAMAHGAHTRASTLRAVPDELVNGETVTVTGVLTSDAAPTRTGVRVELDVDGWRVRATVSGTLVTEIFTDWTRGRTLTAPMRLRQPDMVRNPGSPDPGWQRLHQRVDLLGTIKSAALVDVTPGPWWEDVAAAVRAHVRRTATTYLEPHAVSTRAVVTAILIGDRAGLDDQVTRQLQAAGTFHVIAISGGNIAMLTVGCLLLLRTVTRSQTWPIVITISVVAGYGLVVSGEPSVARAVVAAVMYLALRLIGLVPRPVNLLAVVAAVCVVWAPLTVIEVGAWLSFGATFGLIVVLPRLLAACGPPSAQGGSLGVVWVWLRAACLATVAAEILILPMSAAVFSRVTVAGVVLNLFAIPAMVVAQFAGLASCALALVSASAASASAWLAHVATTILLGSADALDLAPWLSWRVPPVSGAWTMAYYTAVGVTLAAARPRTRHGAAIVAAGLAGVIVTSPFVALERPAPGWLRVAMLDVGQGDATLVQTPGRHALLVDAGGTPAGTFDVGGRVVTPAVWALGERRLDWLALTHGDLDHVGGARRVVEDLHPREVWEGIPVDADPTLIELRQVAQARRIPWRRLLAGHELELGAVQLLVRHPEPPDWQRVRVRNDDSLVLEIRYGDVAIVLTGDAGAEYESRPRPADRNGGPPRIRILKVAHHGSRSSSSAAYLDALNPHVALVSAGASNLFGHPAPDVLARFAQRGVRVFRTDAHGAILIETNGRTVRIRTMGGPVMEIV